MPYTVAHAIAAPPLWRASGRRLVLSAVVAGSMAPDFEYLAHLETERTIGHQFVGVALLDVPLALLALALWHGLVKRALPALFGPGLLPHPDQTPLFPEPRGPATLRRGGLVVISILVGIAGHLAWDAFTHWDGYLTRHVWLLREAIGRPHVYDLLGYASSALGMTLLLVWWWRATERRGSAPENAHLPEPVRRRAVALLGFVTAAGGLATGLARLAEGWGPETVLIDSFLGATAAGLVTLVALSVWLRPKLLSGTSH